MEMNNKKNKERVVNGRSLIDLVLSWSFKDVLNKDMYKNQVKQIPSTFSSTHEYFNSFVTPLIAETHAELKSSTETLSRSLCCEIKFLRPSKDYKPPKDLFYNLVLPSPYRNDAKKADHYEPANGDLFAITRFQPKCIDDLAMSYLVAVVLRVNDSLTHLVLSSAPIPFNEAKILNKKEKLFAVYLINMTTNIRIWQALNSNPKEINIPIITKFLKKSVLLEENCMMCETERVIYDEHRSEERARVWASDLNESQRNAVLSCIRRKECCHENTVKLIWGPPGTGKTKTISFLLHSLLRMKCRTLTCAPTNVAVLQVVKRLVKSVTCSASLSTYGLGDVVLFGNEKRMNIDDHDELHNVFLSHRIEILYRCLAWWRESLISMINLLEDLEEQYRFYLKELETKDSFDEEDEDKDAVENTWSLEEHDKNRNQEDKRSTNDKKGKSILRETILQTMKENKNIQIKMKDEKKEKELNGRGKNGKRDDVSNKEREIVMAKDKKHVEPLTFEEFFIKEFNSVLERLYFCVVNLYTHLPTSLIKLEMAQKMVEAVDTLRSFRALLQDALDLGFQGALKYIFVKEENISRGGFFQG